jgi:hypothetical protein
MILAQTPWAFPTTISQITESDAHIAWDSAGLSYIRFDDASYLRTVKTLQHIPNSFAGDRGMKTWYVLASGFNFKLIPPKITGIIVELKTDRGGRITDDTVQLRTVSTWTGYTGAVGDNKANADLGQKKFYGGTMDLWGWDRIGYTGSLLDTVLRQVILTPNFGIALRFQSHPFWPHNSTPMIDYVRIRLIWDDGNTATDGIEPGDGPGPGQNNTGPGSAGTGGGDGEGTPNLGSSRFGGYRNTTGNNQGDPGQDPFGYQSSFGYDGSGAITGGDGTGFQGSGGGTGNGYSGSNAGYLGSFDSYIPGPPV